MSKAEFDEFVQWFTALPCHHDAVGEPKFDRLIETTRDALKQLEPRNGFTFEMLQKMWEETHYELAKAISERDNYNKALADLAKTAVELYTASTEARKKYPGVQWPRMRWRSTKHGPEHNNWWRVRIRFYRLPMCSVLRYTPTDIHVEYRWWIYLKGFALMFSIYW